MVVASLLILALPIITSQSIIAQNENTSLFLNKKNDSNIWNMKDHTITLVNGTTNETKTIGNFTTNDNETKTIGNFTANETKTVVTASNSENNTNN